MLWLERSQVSAPKQVLQDLIRYSHDKIGRVIKRDDQTPVSSPWLRTVGGPSLEHFAYDKLNRLTYYNAVSLLIILSSLSFVCFLLLIHADIFVHSKRYPCCNYMPSSSRRSKVTFSY